MSIARYSAERARAKARVNPARMKATTERAIARQAKADDTDTAQVDFKAALAQGRLRLVRPVDVAAIRAKTRRR
jgi:hypothetical protein